MEAETETPASSYKLGALEIDLEGYRASFASRPLELSTSQLEVLFILLKNHGRVISRAELSQAVGLQRARSVDVILSSLRKEIGSNFVRNVRNRGWIVVPEALET